MVSFKSFSGCSESYKIVDRHSEEFVEYDPIAPAAGRDSVGTVNFWIETGALINSQTQKGWTRELNNKVLSNKRIDGNHQAQHYNRQLKWNLLNKSVFIWNRS